MTTQYRMPLLKSRREYFRLPYPVAGGAELDVAGTQYKVEEVSERGLRVISSSGALPVAAKIQGVLTLTFGARCLVTGTVLRIDEEIAVVLLEKGPTGYDMMREQRHVSKTFPDWKPQPA